MSGVVDVVVVRDKVWQAVGEIKSDNRTGLSQIVAAMHTLSVKKGYWPYGEGVYPFWLFYVIVFRFQSTGTTSQFLYHSSVGPLLGCNVTRM